MNISLSVPQMLGLAGGAILAGAALLVLLLSGLGSIGENPSDLTYEDNTPAGCGVLGLVLLVVAVVGTAWVLIVT